MLAQSKRLHPAISVEREATQSRTSCGRYRRRLPTRRPGGPVPALRQAYSVCTGTPRYSLTSCTDQRHLAGRCGRPPSPPLEPPCRRSTKRRNLGNKDINGIQDPKPSTALPRAALFRRLGPALDHQDALAGLDLRQLSPTLPTACYDGEQFASSASRCASHQRWLLVGAIC